MRLQDQPRRGAAGQQYAIIVGLISVVAILAITQLGSGMNTLMSRTGNTLTDVVNGSVGSGGGGGGGGPDCASTRASCAAHLAAGCTSDGTYNITGIGSATCNMTLHGGGWTRCFNVTNTSSIDLPHSNQNWFDSCVDYSNAGWSSANQVMVKLNDNTGSTVYSASGNQIGSWTYDQITSTAAFNTQYDTASNHSQKITLSNGHYLTIAGRSSRESGCGGDYGNGYGISIRSTPSGTYHASLRMIVSTTNTPSGSTRLFNGWSSSHEISFSTSDFNTCSSTPAALNYSFEFFVK